MRAKDLITNPPGLAAQTSLRLTLDAGWPEWAGILLRSYVEALRPNFCRDVQEAVSSRIGCVVWVSASLDNFDAFVPPPPSCHTCHATRPGGEPRNRQGPRRGRNPPRVFSVGSCPSEALHKL